MVEGGWVLPPRPQWLLRNSFIVVVGKTNIINIKGITTDSITIMKLTKEQAEEI